jgi:hypothetical protein
MKPTDSRKGAPPHHHYTPEELHNVDVAHEHSDVDLRSLLWSAVMLVVVCVGAAILVYVLFWQLEAQAKARDPRLSRLTLPATLMPSTTLASPEFGSSPAPRLLTNEPEKLMELRASELQELESYGWVDEKAGVARIPIDEAKKLLLERGLPVRPDAITDPSVGTHKPAFGESSSGRTITRAPETATGK